MISSANTNQFEDLIQEVLEREFGTVAAFISPELCRGLRQNLLAYQAAGEMHSAGVGNRFAYQKTAEVRGDTIRWIESQSRDKHERAFIEQIEAFISYLNATCYTGINAYEFHYAFYETGSFYKRHRDQFKSDQGRKFSLVTYLNEDWQEEDGGELALYLEGETIRLRPEGGRAVLFPSDRIEHEVMVASRPRLSIAGWLKRV